MVATPWSPRITRHLAVWMAVCALLLKAAVPMLASASAQIQGKTLVEVCTVYGVATVALDDQAGSQPAPEHAAPHAGDHCALSAVMALAAPEPQPLTATLAAATADPLPLPAALLPARDASAAWVARLKHGPPFLA